MESCAIYQNPSGFGFLIGSLLALGIYVSYIPQHLKIVNRRTSEGLSPLFLLLGSTSGFSSLVNLLLVSSPARKCCLTDLNKFQCIYSQLGLIQVAAQAVGYSLILILCAYLTRPPIDVPGSNEEKIGRAYRWFLIYVVLNAALAIYFLFFNADFNETMAFANFSGILSTILATAQYLPQIHTTYTLKHAGTLSMHMMLLQTPGGYLWSFTLFMQPGSSWSSWLPYFTAANLQLLLLIMCLYYRGRNPEETPLLG
ncbi:hypothetical protein KL938_001116 [Ogataea parapolymorpha]|nr:hypothetical protein KL938_001116 [Ogataea parapolymorpha]